ncbi:hypothetical protein INT45_011075, partial [Circinella minor]
MNCRIIFLNFIRVLLCIFSAGTLGCHIAQIVLLQNNDWWPSYKVYILYFVGAGFSFICSVALVFVIFMPNIRSIRGDRIISILCVALLIAVIIYGSLDTTTVPWVPIDQAMDSQQSQLPSQKGFVTYCSDYSVPADSNLQKIIINRCWLQNGTWLGLIITAALWIVLALYTYLQKKSSMYKDKDVHDYIEDAPMAMNHGNTPSPAAYVVADLHNNEHYQYANMPATITGSPGQQYKALPAGGKEVTPYPTYYNYYDSDNSQFPPPQRQMSYSTDYSGSGAPLYNSTTGTSTTAEASNNNHTFIQPSHTFPYVEKVAAPSLSERSASEPPHSHDGAK